MDSIDVGALRVRARRSYELSRLALGMVSALWALPAIGFSFMTSNSTFTSALLGLGLLIAVIVLRFIGCAYGRAIVPGLVAGSAPLVLPLLLRGGGHACFGGACWSVCMVGCVAGGLVAGAAIGWLSAREAEQRWTFLGAATLLTVLTGSLGCAMVGGAGTIGMLLAVIASSLPASFAAQPRVG